MSKVRGAKTAFEIKIFKEIRRRGFRFKTNYIGIIGKPDIALPKIQKAVFLHSDFWHGWQLSRWKGILPSKFWKEKLEKNRKRDKKVLIKLRRLGWKVLVVWEHQIKKDSKRSFDKIIRFLKVKSARA